MVLKYSRQSLNNIDIKSVVNILKSDWLTSGPTINKFEQTLCKLVGAKYGVMVNSATSALHLACLALGLKKKKYLLDLFKFICCLCKLWPLLWCFS